jgi:hypothetical protein
MAKVLVSKRPEEPPFLRFEGKDGEEGKSNNEECIKKCRANFL